MCGSVMLVIVELSVWMIVVSIIEMVIICWFKGVDWIGILGFMV